MTYIHRIERRWAARRKDGSWVADQLDSTQKAHLSDMKSWTDPKRWAYALSAPADPTTPGSP